MERLRCLGGCLPLLLGALLLDVLGLIVLFVGIFADLRLDGRFYGDFLIYSGALLVFSSLACWLMWYVGNVPVSEEEEEGRRKRSSLVRLVRKLSERLSQRLTGEEGARCDGGQESPPVHKASRVTWGRSTAYHNEGYEDCEDTPGEEKKVEGEKEETQEV